MENQKERRAKEHSALGTKLTENRKQLQKPWVCASTFQPLLLEPPIEAGQGG